MDDKLSSVINEYEQVTGNSADDVIKTKSLPNTNKSASSSSSFFDKFQFNFTYAFGIIFILSGVIMLLLKPSFIYKKYMTKHQDYVYEFNYSRFLTFTTLISFLIFSLFYAYKKNLYQKFFV